MQCNAMQYNTKYNTILYTTEPQVLEDNQLHDLNKAVMEMQSELMMIGNSLLANFSHLRADLKKEEHAASMY